MERVQVIYIRDRSSGRVHKGTKVDGNPTPLTYEADNLDQAGEWDEITVEQLAEVDIVDFCDRCWPK